MYNHRTVFLILRFKYTGRPWSHGIRKYAGPKCRPTWRQCHTYLIFNKEAKAEVCSTFSTQTANHRGSRDKALRFAVNAGKVVFNTISSLPVWTISDTRYSFELNNIWTLWIKLCSQIESRFHVVKCETPVNGNQQTVMAAATRRQTYSLEISLTWNRFWSLMFL